MNPHPDDPRITAYVLGELPAEDVTAIEQAAAADPAIREKIQEVEQTRQFLKDRLATPTAKLHPHQRENVRRSAQTGAVHPRAISWKSLQPWIIPTAAAAVLALATIILFRGPSEKPAQTAGTTRTAPTDPTPLRSAAPPAPKDIPPPPQAAVFQKASNTPADGSSQVFPILPGRPKLDAITRSIVDKGTLPPPDSVRLAEILNSFPLRLNGTSAIARGLPAPEWHPDDLGSGVTSHLATVSTETIACPWKPSSTLLLISVRANGQKDCDVKIAFRANPDNVSRYRLLGFPSENDNPAAPPPTRLSAGDYTTLAIEIDPSKPGSDLGSLEWSADGKSAPSISLHHKPDTEPSDDARFATLVCTYSQWLAREQTGIIDTEIVSALARETTSATLPADRAEFLKLVEKSLKF